MHKFLLQNAAMILGLVLFAGCATAQKAHDGNEYFSSVSFEAGS